MNAFYTRQSLFKKDSLSTSQQADYCIASCPGEPYEIFEDLGYSGKNLNRPAFERMMEKVRSGQITKILVYKLDRISRNISDFANLLCELKEYNCEFQSVSENFDTTTPIGRAMIYICMVFAQMERENTSQRVHDNYYYRTELGFWGGGVAPFGYKLAKIKYKGKCHTVLEPDEETAPLVKQLYDWYLEPNSSISTILNKLNNELKIPGRKGGLWTSRVIADILSRPLYAPNDMNMYNYLSGLGATITNPPEDFDGMASVDLYGKKSTSSSKHPHVGRRSAHAACGDLRRHHRYRKRAQAPPCGLPHAHSDLSWRVADDADQPIYLFGAEALYRPCTTWRSGHCGHWLHRCGYDHCDQAPSGQGTDDRGPLKI